MRNLCLKLIGSDDPKKSLQKPQDTFSEKDAEKLYEELKTQNQKAEETQPPASTLW